MFDPETFLSKKNDVITPIFKQCNSTDTQSNKIIHIVCTNLPTKVKNFPIAIEQLQQCCIPRDIFYMFLTQIHAEKDFVLGPYTMKMLIALDMYNW